MPDGKTGVQPNKGMWSKGMTYPHTACRSTKNVDIPNAIHIHPHRNIRRTKPCIFRKRPHAHRKPAQTFSLTR